jgi:hypothetical protein
MFLSLGSVRGHDVGGMVDVTAHHCWTMWLSIRVSVDSSRPSVGWVSLWLENHRLDRVPGRACIDLMRGLQFCRVPRRLRGIVSVAVWKAIRRPVLARRLTCMHALKAAPTTVRPAQP